MARKGWGWSQITRSETRSVAGVVDIGVVGVVGVVVDVCVVVDVADVVFLCASMLHHGIIVSS